MPRTAVSLGLLALLGCGQSEKSEQPAPAPQQPLPPAPHDADVVGITTINGYDPSSGLHLDEGGRGGDPARPNRPRGGRSARQIDIILKSSPSGALVAVDGQTIGSTPAYWNGEDGREHEFTFVLPRYAVARYRFVPVTSGTVHARLDPIADDGPDGGLPPAVAPHFAPDAPPPPSPPPPPAPSAPDAEPADPMPREEPRGPNP